MTALLWKPPYSVLRLPGNAQGRDFVVGDIHGCLSQFTQLLDVVNFDETHDRVFSVGDLIDRGPHSRECLDLLRLPWFYAVSGNHEEMLVEACARPEAVGVWYANGGQWGRDHKADLPALAGLLRDLPIAIVVGDGDAKFNVMHAEFFGSQDDLEAGRIDAFMAGQMRWGRSVISAHSPPPANLARTYVGHTPVDRPRVIGPFHFIDTGSFKPYFGSSGAMTMVLHQEKPVCCRSELSAALFWGDQEAPVGESNAH